MKKITIIFLIIFSIFFLNASAHEECTIAVVSGKVTKDGRPILWKNRDIPIKYRNNDIRYIKGEKYDFLGLMTVGYNQYVWAGTNTEGLCIVNAASRDLAGTKRKSLGNGEFLKVALGSCNSIEEFEKLLQATNWPGRSTNCNYALIDSKGNAVLFETRNYSYTKFDANNPKVAPNGFIVRTNFALTSNGDGGIIRYNRANNLFNKGMTENTLDYKFVIQQVSRDIADESGEKYKLPFYNSKDEENPFSIDTSNTINRNSTSAAIVFRGIKKDEPVELTTMWSVLGNPILSIASPSWIASGKVPNLLTGEKGSPICKNAIAMYDSLYYPKKINGKTVRFLSTLQLPVIKKQIVEAENILFDKTDNFLARVKAKKNVSTASLCEFQEIAGKLANSYLTKISKNVTENSPLIVGVYGDQGASPICVTETMAALEIDPEIVPVVVKGADISAGILNSLDVIVFPGGSGSKEASSMGSACREKIRQFVMEDGKGCVGICAGGYLLSSTPIYKWSLKLTSSSVFDRAHYNRGRGLIELALTEKGKEIFPELSMQKSFFLQYYDGPILVREETSPLPEYEEYGQYVTDIHLTGGSQSGVTPGKTALLLNNAGKGKVFVIIGHPEATPGLRWMVSRMVRVVTNRKLISYPKNIVRPERETKAILFNTENTKKEKQLFWKLVGDSEKEQISALKKLVEMRSRPSLRWAIGLLRDKSNNVRMAAAMVLSEAEYTPSIGDLKTALQLETDDECKKVMKKSLTKLETIVIHEK